MKKTILVLMLFVLSVCLLTGCTEKVLSSINTKQEDELMVELFNAFEDGDYSSVMDKMPVDSLANAEEAFREVSDYIDGHVIDYKKIGYHIKTVDSNENKTVYSQIVYDVDTEFTRYVVTMIMQKNEDTDAFVSGFNVMTFKEYKSNGAIINFDKFDVVQLLLLIFSAACLGLVVYALVMCAKSRIRPRDYGLF